jgi:hypothetical protein
MDIPTSQRLTNTGALSALFALFSVLTVFSLSYLFCVGVAEAVSLHRRVPNWLRPFAAAYSRPAHLVAELPVAMIPARLGIELGYSFADGPDTTR